ncbi:MAG: 16S rRNA (uracil(1498)-N(3))-methyltransferase [Woeseiaceae bacterium]|nr:16S rRNA (uracil(1498)-N(3))-methyltransferase [Woeseiaceae bacterium]
MNTRIHVDAPLESGSELQLGRDHAHYLGRVLRLRTGAQITVFDGAGNAHDATIGALGRNDARITLGERQAGDRESPLAVSLVQGVSRGERMDVLVQKATELGVARVLPVLTERSVVRLDAVRGEKRRGHWQKIAVAACEQCGRNRLPVIDAPSRLEDYLARPPGAQTRLLFSPAATRRLRDLGPPADSRLEVLVGPEGGLTAAEERTAAAKGFMAVSMGPRVLRSETAGIAALALLQGQWGDI